LKLFQKLLLAPAALGLMAPVAASASELNIAGVSQYGSEEQVTSITQFSDVQPTDWAYQALSNLIERYGCVAGYPNGTYRGSRAMTRFEAAALLNACLDRITDVTDELKRLMKEFEKELAVLKGRVDGLEAKVAELEATQFSTTTKLKGIATFVMGANSFGGSNSNISDAAKTLEGATAFNYDVRLNFDTSFTGKDLLRTTLRSGNFGDSPWGAAGTVGANGANLGLNALEVAFQEDAGPNVVGIDRLFYQFPVGDKVTVTFGGRVRQDDMLAMWPSVYPADTVLDVFTYAGSPGTYSLNKGAGAGVWYADNGWSFSLNYVSANANVGNPNEGGIGTDGAAQTFTGQLGYAGDSWGAAVAYNYGNGVGPASGTPAAVLQGAFAGAGSNNSVAVSAYWQPSESGWVPSISLGWGITSYSSDNTAFDFDGVASQSWYVGLQWDDAFIKGNALGMAVGQPTFVTACDKDLCGASPKDGNYAWEWWYKFQVTDNISVTPALYYLSNPLGQLGWELNNKRNDSAPLTNFGGIIKTTFKF
jgi:hypothetical protein